MRSIAFCHAVTFWQIRATATAIDAAPMTVLGLFSLWRNYDGRGYAAKIHRRVTLSRGDKIETGKRGAMRCNG